MIVSEEAYVIYGSTVYCIVFELEMVAVRVAVTGTESPDTLATKSRYLGSGRKRTPQGRSVDCAAVTMAASDADDDFEIAQTGWCCAQAAWEAACFRIARTTTLDLKRELKFMESSWSNSAEIRSSESMLS